MKDGEKNRDKELYKLLRTRAPEELWEQEVPQFDRVSADERLKRVSLIRAVGVVFSESGTEPQKKMVRAWLHQLLRDPVEKIRRYAMAALPKIGAAPEDEKELLSLFRSTDVEREKKFIADTLNKIGGSATLGVIQACGAALPGTEQKVKANVARSETPSVIQMDRALIAFDGIRIQLRGRSGLEEIVREEIDAVARGKFRVLQMRAGLVTIAPTERFTLGELYALRCFGTVGFVLAQLDDRTGNVTEAIAAAITSPRARSIFETFTEGPVRYRLEFVSKGHQRGAVRQIVERAYAIAPMILNDARNAPWAVDIHTEGGKHSVELRPRLTPDPRLWFRQQDVPAASHPPLAACMARLGAQPGDEIVWDPFCGSGLELIERSLLGGVRKAYGTDRSREAIEITKANVAAAGLESTPSSFICCDFRDFAKAAGVLPNSLSLIITNPPLGMRVPIRNLHGLIADLLTISAKMLRPGGRLVFANPVRVEPVDATLRLQSRRVVDFGGFDCRLEVYTKIKGEPKQSGRGVQSRRA